MSVSGYRPKISDSKLATLETELNESLCTSIKTDHSTKTEQSKTILEFIETTLDILVKCVEINDEFIYHSNHRDEAFKTKVPFVTLDMKGHFRNWFCSLKKDCSIDRLVEILTVFTKQVYNVEKRNKMRIGRDFSVKMSSLVTEVFQILANILMISSKQDFFKMWPGYSIMHTKFLKLAEEKYPQHRLCVLHSFKQATKCYTKMNKSTEEAKTSPEKLKNELKDSTQKIDYYRKPQINSESSRKKSENEDTNLKSRKFCDDDSVSNVNTTVSSIKSDDPDLDPDNSFLTESREPDSKRTRQSFTSMTKIELVEKFQNLQTQDSRLTMADFCRQREICVRTFRIWVKNYPELLKSKHDNRKKKRTVWKKSLESSVSEDEIVEENKNIDSDFSGLKPWNSMRIQNFSTNENPKVAAVGSWNALTDSEDEKIIPPESSKIKKSETNRKTWGNTQQKISQPVRPLKNEPLDGTSSSHEPNPLNERLLKMLPPNFEKSYLNQIYSPYLSYTIQFKSLETNTIETRNISGQLLFINSKRCQQLLTYEKNCEKSLILPEGLNPFAIKTTMSYVHGLELQAPEKHQILPLYTVVAYFEIESILKRLVRHVRRKYGDMMDDIFRETDRIVKKLDQIVLR